MSELFIYFLCGMAGLILQMGFPTLHLDWLSLILGRVAVEQGARGAILWGAALALLFGAVSVESPVFLFLPRFFCLLLWSFSPKWFSFSASGEAFLLTFFLSLASSLASLRFQAAPADFAWAAATGALGAWVLPGAWAGLRRQGVRFFQRHHRPEPLDGLERRRSALHKLDGPRSRYGLHKGG